MKALVVIPNDSTYVAIWALERSVQLHNLGYEVTCLDLSALDYSGFLGKFRYLLENFSHKFRWKSVAKTLLKEGFFSFKSTNLFHMRRKYSLSDSEIITFNRAAVASFAWNFGTSKIEMTMIPTSELKRGKLIFSRALQILGMEVRLNHYDLITTVNGRGFADSATIQVAIENQIKYEVIEKTSDNWSYISLMNSNSQDLVEISQIVSDMWDSFSAESKIEKNVIALDYLDAKVSRTQSLGLSESKILDLFSFKKTVVFYPGSDYEIAAFPTISGNHSVFKDQYEAFQALAKACKELDLELAVRVHPHIESSILAKVENDIWAKLTDDAGASIIYSSDLVSSLELSSQAHLNVVYESSVGVELAYLKHPVVIMTHTSYAPFVKNLQAFDVDGLKKFLQNPSKLEDPNSLIPWGYFMATGHIKIQNFKIFGHDEIFFRDRMIDKVRPRIARFREKIYYLISNSHRAS